MQSILRALSSPFRRRHCAFCHSIFDRLFHSKRTAHKTRIMTRLERIASQGTRTARVHVFSR